MEYVTLKNSDLKVSRLCMGGCPMGGYGWGEVQEKDLIAAVHAALDNGVNIFDTADTYGLGQSERTLSKALAGRRNEVVIADKFGVRAGNGATYYDNSPSYIRQALETSLKNLGTDYIDLYQVHYRDGKTPLSDVIGELENLKQAGKIRYYGLSNIHEADYDELKPHIGKIVSVQDEYSLACRKNEKTLRTLDADFRISLLTWGSLGQGILTGKYDKTVTFDSNDRRSREIYVNFHGDKLLKNLEIVEVMKEMASAHNKPVSAVAIRFILDWLENSVVLVGVKRPGQMMGNLESMDWHLSSDELKKLDEVSME